MKFVNIKPVLALCLCAVMMGSVLSVGASAQEAAVPAVRLMEELALPVVEDTNPETEEPAGEVLPAEAPEPEVPLVALPLPEETAEEIPEPEETAALDGESGVELSDANFPDAVFLAVAEDFDTDKNGWLSETELAAVTEISCGSMGITDLTGLGYFFALQSLDCSWNTLSAGLDVSGNGALTYLNCSVCGLRELDVSENGALGELWCYGNFLLGSLDLSGNPALEALFCGDTAIASLDLSANAALKTLNTVNDPITAIDLSHNTELVKLACSSNALTALDLTGNTKLEELSCAGMTNFASLDISACSALRRIYINESPALAQLDISGCPLLVDAVANGTTETYEDEHLIIHYQGELTEENPVWTCGIQRDMILTLITGIDLTGDGVMTEADAEIIICYAAGLCEMTNETLLTTADVNTDGSVDARDATKILRFANDLPSALD